MSEKILWSILRVVTSVVSIRVVPYYVVDDVMTLVVSIRVVPLLRR